MAQRLQDQVDALLREGISDDWLELLRLVCYAGRLGCTVNLVAAKNEIHCSTMHAAIRRLKDEYLIREVDENTIEALHPVRAKIILMRCAIKFAPKQERLCSRLFRVYLHKM